MFVNDLMWEPLSEPERKLLTLLLSQARQSVYSRTPAARRWRYRAQVIELLLDNPKERGEDLPLADLVTFIGFELINADERRFGYSGRITGKRKMQAFQGLPGVAAHAFLLFLENVATCPRRSPFDGSVVRPSGSL
ncbi:hypothetical protein [Pseudomonas sp. DG56-2]|uniref:hypothetical protein n=1 Tax=Pseudomonas sp. DG56-2 TaxID=2320270 RepID=UPI0010A6B086|nr:hypothetical protein [Pseudomonas sp. DG56-2]